jgi:peptidoglycan/LPS O-acetylase OafA/YrhL
VGARVQVLLGRVTSGGELIPEIDGLRFAAIATVLLFHLAAGLASMQPAVWTVPASGLLPTLARNGFHGVDFFFIISGFILALPFARHHLLDRERVSLRRYFLRRLTRLEPPYVVALLMMFAALVARGRGDAAGLLPHLAASIGYQHNLLFGAPSALLNVAWTLEIEVQFYVLVPLLASVFALRDTRVRRGVMAMLILACLVANILWITPGTRSWLAIPRFLHFFLTGFLLADLYLVDWKQAPTRRASWDVVSLIGWPLLFLIWSRFPADPGTGEHQAVLPTLAAPAILLLLYIAAFRGSLSNRVARSPWTVLYGGMCYSLYLLHVPLYGLFARATVNVHPFSNWEANILLQSVLVIPAMSAVVVVYFVLIEKPCMQRDWPAQLWAAVRAPASARSRA